MSKFKPTLEHLEKLVGICEAEKSFSKVLFAIDLNVHGVDIGQLNGAIKHAAETTPFAKNFKDRSDEDIPVKAVKVSTVRVSADDEDFAKCKVMYVLKDQITADWTKKFDRLMDQLEGALDHSIGEKIVDGMSITLK